MAKKNKRPNHARLVVPGGVSPKADTKKPPKQAAKKQAPPADESDERSSRFDNTIDLTKDGALIRKKAARRRKRRHSLQMLLLVVLFVGVLFLYFSGIYRTAVLKATDIVEGISISLKGSGSFPLAFDIGGYVESDNLGGNAIAVLGERDMAIVSASGRELSRFQHGYGNPHITASDTRVCLYNRGGNELTIEGRDKRITSRTTERDILFAEMSPNGALALATASRFRASIEIYSNFADDEPQFSWEITEEKPYSAAFMSDNKHLALACVSTEGGAIHTNIYLLHANRTQVQATINGGEATVLDMQYLSQSRVLVVYDSYAALYNGKGEETARYEYGGQDIVTMHSNDGVTALVFGSVSGNRLTTVLLDSGLTATATISTETVESPRVLVGKKAVYLLTGYEVTAYDFAGVLLNSQTLAYKGYDLVWAGEALLVTAGDIQDLGPMAKPEEDEAESGLANSTLQEDEAEEAGAGAEMDEPETPTTGEEETEGTEAGQDDAGDTPPENTPGDGTNGEDGTSEPDAPQP